MAGVHCGLQKWPGREPSFRSTKPTRRAQTGPSSWPPALRRSVTNSIMMHCAPSRTKRRMRFANAVAGPRVCPKLVKGPKHMIRRYAEIRHDTAGFAGVRINPRLPCDRLPQAAFQDAGFSCVSMGGILVGFPAGRRRVVRRLVRARPGPVGRKAFAGVQAIAVMAGKLSDLCTCSSTPAQSRRYPAAAPLAERKASRICFSVSISPKKTTPIATISSPSNKGTASVPNTA